MTATTPAATTAPVPIPAAELEREGFVPGAPDEWTDLIDSAGVYRIHCACCRHRGLTYRPFVQRFKHTDLTGRYKIFLLCESCGHAVEA